MASERILGYIFWRIQGESKFGNEKFEIIRCIYIYIWSNVE